MLPEGWLAYALMNPNKNGGGKTCLISQRKVEIELKNALREAVSIKWGKNFREKKVVLVGG